MNAYTKGKEYFLENGKQYIGYYHVVKGKYYTGIKHVYGVSQRLYKPDKKDKKYTEQGLKYKSIIQKHYLNSKSIKLATVPSESQWSKNIHTIYILKDIKTNQIYEVTKACYEDFVKSKQYKTFLIKRKNGKKDSDIAFNRKQLNSVKDEVIRYYLIQNRGF